MDTYNETPRERDLNPDPDRTMPGSRRPDAASAGMGTPGGGDAPSDLDRTMPNMRVRREQGELAVGDVVLGRYELLEKLGSGAMGVVYQCRDRVSRVEFALKMVPPELVRDAEAMESILENFQLVQGLSHPNIANVKFLERDEYGAYFLVMEYAPGESLSQWIRRKWKTGRPEPGEAADIVKQIAAALDYAHGMGVLHRDVKPANVMVSGTGRVKVLDFGLASKVRSSMSMLSVDEETASGTPHYLAPEQFRGKRPRPASDQYALGVLTYQMLSGELPYDAESLDVLRSAVLNEDPDPVDGISPAANECLRKALDKDPKVRFASCSEFADALEKALAEPVAPKKEVPPPPPPVKPQVQSAQPPPPPQAPPRAPAAKTPPAHPARTSRLVSETGIQPPVSRPAQSGSSPSAAPRNASSVSCSPRGAQSDSGGKRKHGKHMWIVFVALFVLARFVYGVIHDGDREQSETASHSGGTEQRVQIPAGDKTIALPGGVKLEMMKVEAGSFEMSAKDGENYGDEVAHRATLTKAFYIGRTEVTQAQWRAVMGTNPSNFNGDDLPVEQVSWNDAMEFCGKLNDSGKAPSGWKFTLPTETQWEYAARGGKKSKGYKYSGSDSIGEVAWYDENFGGKTHPVGRKTANELGLYDMSGNVWEWCLDDWNSDSGRQKAEFTRGNDRGGSRRVRRGGSWINFARDCRSASRINYDPGDGLGILGFRVALVPVQ